MTIYNLKSDKYFNIFAFLKMFLYNTISLYCKFQIIYKLCTYYRLKPYWHNGDP